MSEHDYLVAHAGRVVTAADLETHGIDRNAVMRLRRDGRLVRMFHRVYAVVPVDDDEFALACRAALRYGGAGAMLIGETSLAFASTYPAPAAPEIGVPKYRGVRQTPGLRVAHCADETLRRRRVVRGVAAQHAGEAVAWAWSRLPSLDDRRAVLCAAVECGAATVTAVRGALIRCHRMRGRSSLAEACDQVDAGCRSPAEIEYLTRVERQYGLPAGERQARIDVPGGRVRFVDVRYGRVVVEIDGEHHRLDPASRQGDTVRDVVLTALGLQVLRIPAREVRRCPGWVAATVLQALAQPA